jgi:maleylpyruvate isomerase
VRGVVTGLRRELEYQRVHLVAGYQPGGGPADLAATELARVTALMGRRAGAPPMTLTSPARLRIPTAPEVDVTGPPAALLAWLSGRGDDSACTQTTQPRLPSRHWPR